MSNDCGVSGANMQHMWCHTQADPKHARTHAHKQAHTHTYTHTRPDYQTDVELWECSVIERK